MFVEQLVIKFPIKIYQLSPDAREQTIHVAISYLMMKMLYHLIAYLGMWSVHAMEEKFGSKISEKQKYGLWPFKLIKSLKLNLGI